MMSTGKELVVRLVLSRPLYNITAVKGHTIQYSLYSSSPKTDAKPLESIPGPLSLPVIGSSYKYLKWGELNNKDISISYQRLHDRYGTIVREALLPGYTHVHLFDPHDIEHVFRTCDRNKPPLRAFLNAIKKYKELRGRPLGLGNSMDESWTTQRSPTQKHMLRPRAVSVYFPGISQVAEDFVHFIREKRDDRMLVQSFHDKLQRYALEAVGVLLFDDRIGILMENPEGKELADKFFHYLKSLFPIEQKLLTADVLNKPSSKEWEQYVETNDFIYKVSEESVSQREKTLKEMTDKQEQSRGLTLIENLLKDPTLAREDVIDIISSLLTASTDTTSNTLMTIIYYLAKNPEVQQTLHEEIKRCIQDQKIITANQLEELRYVKAVVKEGFRLNPTVAANSRIPTEDMILQGYLIPAGTTLLLHSKVPSNNSLFFEDPEKFKPERWLGGASKKSHPFAFLPFGYGLRSCIGRRFAEQEIYLLLAKVFQNFRVEYEGPDLKFETKTITFPQTEIDYFFYER